MYFFALFVSVLQICSIYSDRTSDTSKTFLCQCNKPWKQQPWKLLYRAPRVHVLLYQNQIENRKKSELRPGSFVN